MNPSSRVKIHEEYSPKAVLEYFEYLIRIQNKKHHPSTRIGAVLKENKLLIKDTKGWLLATITAFNTLKSIQVHVHNMLFKDFLVKIAKEVAAKMNWKEIDVLKDKLEKNKY